MIIDIVPFQDNESHNDKFPSYSELQIKWPKELKDFICTEQSHASDNIEKDFKRPDSDSGVGESVKFFTCYEKHLSKISLSINRPNYYLIPLLWVIFAIRKHHYDYHYIMYLP